MASFGWDFIKDTPDILNEVKEIQRSSKVVALTIAAEIECHAAILIGQGCELCRPVDPVAADPMQKNQQVAIAPYIDGETRRHGCQVVLVVHDNSVARHRSIVEVSVGRVLHNFRLCVESRGVMNSSSLNYFLSAYRHRSIGKACRELGLSQPALSKTIRRLEDELRVPLFQRTPLGIEPTSYGHTLARRASIIHNEIGRAVSEIETLRGHLGGEARIGVGPALAASLVSDVLAHFLRDRPQMVVHLLEGLYEPLSEAVITGRYDFAVTTRPSTPIPTDLSATLLFKDRFVIAAGASHPLAKRRKLQPADLIDHAWVLPPRGGLLWPRIVDVFERLGLRAPVPKVETNSSGCMIALLRAGTFLSLIPSHLVEHDLKRREVTILKVASLQFDRDVIVLRRTESALAPAAEAFLAHLTDFIQRK